MREVQFWAGLELETVHVSYGRIDDCEALLDA
jgi:hypothetical protein